MPRKRKCDSGYETWNFCIANCEYTYSFGINKTPDVSGTYSGHSHLALRGIAVNDQGIRSRTGQIYIVFDPQMDMPEALSEKRPKTASIGRMITRKNNFEALLSLPQQNSTNVIQLLNAGRFKYVQLHGRRERNGVFIEYVGFSINKAE